MTDDATPVSESSLHLSIPRDAVKFDMEGYLGDPLWKRTKLGHVQFPLVMLSNVAEVIEFLQEWEGMALRVLLVDPMHEPPELPSDVHVELLEHQDNPTTVYGEPFDDA